MFETVIDFSFGVDYHFNLFWHLVVKAETLHCKWHDKSRESDL